MKHLICILSTSLGLLLTHSAKSQTMATDNKVAESITFTELPGGSGVYGIFEGRTPCNEIYRQLGAQMPAGCDHLKWRLILFRDTATLKPATYTLVTEIFEYRALKGKWKIIHGRKNDASAVVYVLEDGQPGKPIYLLKGDENVLFILDENFKFLTGNQNFSFTLNRVRKVLQKRPGN